MPDSLTNSFAVLHDYCRVEKIPINWTDVPNGPQDAQEWTCTITLYDPGSPEARHFTSSRRASHKKAARTLAANNACEHLKLKVTPAPSG
ncbi:hypothetical protein FRB95_014424 [Tulasnella sp. JGI-2019a]|nr:hypothetical protein FRB93_013938 [Tulasnella sp. JGI-2019a]KAG9033737.1 hypothetical protein FRB95_014424 [Tulasnella sp. JGI-2019a]